MSIPRRRFSRELKLEAVRRVQETGRVLRGLPPQQWTLLGYN